MSFNTNIYSMSYRLPAKVRCIRFRLPAEQQRIHEYGGGIDMAEELAKVLVVDDHMMNRQLAGNILADMFQVTSVKSGEAALDYFTKELPDMVLLDIHMPGIDGFEVLARMMANPVTENIPVIFLTADDDHKVEMRGFAAGAVDFITKPFNPAIMQERVKRCIELSRLRQNLRREVDKQTARTQLLSLQLVQVLVNTIEARDKKTTGHSERVANYSWEIANRLGWPEDRREAVYYMALLHDIGRIAVPDAIIAKKGELTPEEQEVIQQTTVIGANILRDVTEMRDIWKGAKYHKENYDGSGYPDGLKGSDIPAEARIIAVACAYDEWLVQEGLPPKTLKEKLAAASDAKFDPLMVDVMLRLIEEGRIKTC